MKAPVYFIGFPVLLILLFLAAQETEAITRCWWWTREPIRTLNYDDANYFLSGVVTMKPNSSCTGGGFSLTVAELGMVLVRNAGNAAEDLALTRCQNSAPTTVRVYLDPVGGVEDWWVCSDILPTAPAPPRVARAQIARPTSTPVLWTGVEMIKNTDLRVSAEAGLRSGIQFQRVDEVGVGAPSALALGYLDAVNVWGAISASYEVCFPQQGSVVFVDTSTLPRAVMAVEFYVTDDGYTCAKADRAGTLVLVKSTGSTAEDDAEKEDGENETTVTLPEDNSAEKNLDDCRVTTQYLMNVRSGPAGAVLRLAASETTLSASGRTEHWFKITHNGESGWIAAWLVKTEGECDYSSESA